MAKSSMINCVLSSSGFWSQLRLILPSLALTGLGLRLGNAISSSGIQKKKRVSPLELNTKGSSEPIKVHDDYKEDFISRLPDDILCSILSQLNMKDAVRTSILSSRWRNLYLFLPKLSFDCLCTFMPLNRCCTCRTQYKQGFLTVMDRFLQLPPGHKITSFQLSFCLGREFTSHVERWMHCIARLDVEELLVRFCCDPFVIDALGNYGIRELITCPFQLLSEASMLRSLSLFACNLEPNFQGPFSSLTFLRLDVVSLVNGEVQSILSSCPKLESLILTYCGLPSKLFIGGPELELKFLTISSCFGVEGITLYAGNLTTFEVVCCNTILFSLLHGPKLQQVYFRLNHRGDLPYIIGWVAKDLPQLESLYVASGSPGMFYLPEELPTLSNLRQIYLLMKINDFFGVQKVAALTIACPHLQRLHLVVEGKRNALGGVRSSPRNHHHLKEVEFGGFLGLQNEISLILYLLKGAVALEKMLISRDYRYYTGGRRWVKAKKPPFGKKELETFHQQLQGQAASSTAQVIIR